MKHSRIRTRLLAFVLTAALLVTTLAVSGLSALAATHTLSFEAAVLSSKYAASGTNDNTVNQQTSVKLNSEGGNTFMEFKTLTESAPTFMPGFRIKSEAGDNLTFNSGANPYYKVALKAMPTAIAADATVELRFYWGSIRWADLERDHGNTQRDYVTMATFTAADIADGWLELDTIVQLKDGGVAPYYGNGLHVGVMVTSGSWAGNVIRVDDVELTEVQPASLLTLTLEPGVGSLQRTVYTAVSGDVITLPVPVASAEHVGWEDADGNPIADADATKAGFQYEVTANITLYAVYEYGDSVLHLNFNDGQGGDTLTMLTGQQDSVIPWPADPVREGFTFTGWVKADGTPVGDTFPRGISTVYASWDPVATHTPVAGTLSFEGTLSDVIQQQFTAVSDFTNHTADGDKALKTTIKVGLNSQRQRPRFVLDGKVEAGARYAITMYVKPTADTASMTAYVAAITDPASNIGKTTNPGGNDCHRLQDNVLWSVGGGDFTTAKEVRDMSLKGGVWNRLTILVPSVTLHESGKDNYLSVGITDYNTHGGMAFTNFDMYVDDVTLVKLPADLATDNAAMDMEVLADRVGTNLDIRHADGHSATVFYGEGDNTSLLIKDTKGDTGNERAQIVLTDGAGDKIALEYGKNYQISFRVKLREGGAWVGNENGFRFWLVPSAGGAAITDSSLNGVKNTYRVFESADGYSYTGKEGEWITVEETFTAENVAQDVSGDLVLGISTYFSAGSFWLDDILIQEVKGIEWDPNATVQDFSNYKVGDNTFSLHQNNVVSDKYDHTDGTGKSLQITNSNWSGSDRNQIRLMDPASGQPLKLTVGKEYLLSFWVYLPDEAQEVVCLNVWLSTTDDSSTRITAKGEVNCEIDDGGVSEGTELAVGEWTRVTRYFIPKNGQEVIIGLCDSYRQFSSVKYYVDDIELADPTLCSVTLDGNGSGENEILQHVVDTRLENLPEPVRPGYNFVGWCWDKEGQYIFNNAIVSGDLTLYAAWMPVDELQEDGSAEDEGGAIETPTDKEPEYVTLEKWETVLKDPSEIPQFDVGERPTMEQADEITDPVTPDTDTSTATQTGLPTWSILLIIVGGVLVVGGGALAALLMLRRKAANNKEVA